MLYDFVSLNQVDCDGVYFVGTSIKYKQIQINVALSKFR